MSDKKKNPFDRLIGYVAKKIRETSGEKYRSFAEIVWAEMEAKKLIISGNRARINLEDIHKEFGELVEKFNQI